MDYQNRHASKPGAGGPASAQQMELERREHLKRLAMEMVDLDKVRGAAQISSIFRNMPCSRRILTCSETMLAELNADFV